MASSDALVDQLQLVGLPGDVSVNELCHLDVVGEDVQRKLPALSNGDELELIVVRLGLGIQEGHVAQQTAAVLERRERLDQFTQLHVGRDISEAEALRLLVEVVAQTDGMVRRRIVLQLMEQERVVVLLEQPHLHVRVTELHHVVEVVTQHRVLLNKEQTALAHEEQREVIIGTVRFLHVSVDSPECLLINGILQNLGAISRAVEAVHLVKLSLNALDGVQVRDRNDSDASLLEELDMSPRHVATADVAHMLGILLIILGLARRAVRLLGTLGLQHALERLCQDTVDRFSGAGALNL